MPRALAWLAPALYMLMVIGLSSIPGTVDDGGKRPPLSWLPALIVNGLHVPLYAGLALVWCGALATATAMPPRRVAVAAVVLATAFGVVDELYQHLTPGRGPALHDAAANAVGAALGVALYLYIHKRVLRRRAGRA